MQKRMFRDKFGLTDLVLSGQKIQTRDVIKIQDERINYLRGWNLDYEFAEFGRAGEEPLMLYPKYCVGEVVAVAQSYQKAGIVFAPIRENALINKRGEKWGNARKSAGWENKIFVKPDLMPHAIKITKIQFERLQDISDEDCMREGIIEHTAEIIPNYPPYTQYCCGISDVFCDTPRQAFAALIDKINGKGTWESNPYVWAYDFELVK